jgi:hypothetical protein
MTHERYCRLMKNEEYYIIKIDSYSVLSTKCYWRNWANRLRQGSNFPPGWASPCGFPSSLSPPEMGESKFKPPSRSPHSLRLSSVIGRGLVTFSKRKRLCNSQEALGRSARERHFLWGSRKKRFASWVGAVLRRTEHDSEEGSSPETYGGPDRGPGLYVWVSEDLKSTRRLFVKVILCQGNTASNIYPLHEESSLVITVRGRIGLATTVETVVLRMGGDVSGTNEKPSVRHVGLVI